MSIAEHMNTQRRTVFAGAIGGLTRRFDRYKTYRRTLNELESLSDRELADLGIHKSQIRGIAYQAAYDG